MHVARNRRLVTAASIVGVVAIAAVAAIASGAWPWSAAALDRACRERPTSACVLKAAEQEARSIDMESQSSLREELAKTYALLGRPDEAIRSADLARDPASSLSSVAGTLTDIGRLDDALRVARLIKDPNWRAWALVGVALAANKAGQGELAGRVVDEARQLAGLSAGSFLVDAPPPIASLLVQLGRLDQAMEVADAISNPERRTRVLVAVAHLLATNGRIDEAKRVAAAARDPSGRSWVLGQMVDALATAGRIDEALRIAGEISEADVHAPALAQIAVALVRAKQDERADHLFAEAWKTADTIGGADTDKISQARAVVIRGLARSGRLARAEALAGILTNPFDRALVPAFIGAGHALAGDSAQARRALQRAMELAGSGPYRFAVQERIFEVLVRAGAIDEAERLASALDNSTMESAHRRDMALWAVVRAAAAEGRFAQATRIIDAMSADTRTYANLSLVAALAQAGARDKRMELVSQALDLALAPVTGHDARSAGQRDKDKTYRFEALARIGEALAKAGM